MPTAQSKARYGRWIAISALMALIIPWSLVHARRTFQERRPVDPQGEIEIVDVFQGVVEIEGWDRSEVDVSSTADESVDRIEVTNAGNRTSIHVLSRGSGGGGNLIIHVPAKSALTATVVGADLKVKGVLGYVKLQTVSGNVSGEVGGDVSANSVNGGVRLTARAAKMIEVQTISGDIELTGGGGEVDVATVSGRALVELGDVSRIRFRSISGDMTFALGLASDGRIEGESVSGNLNLKFAAEPAAEFDVESFSGSIKNCFGPKPMDSRYGPGSRLQFNDGEGHGRVRVNTKNGDIRLCVKGMNNSHASTLSLAQATKVRFLVPYVY